VPTFDLQIQRYLVGTAHPTISNFCIVRIYLITSQLLSFPRRHVSNNAVKSDSLLYRQIQYTNGKSYFSP